MKINYLIVGAGLSASIIAERIANILKKEVLVIDRRNHIGGNIYDYKDKNNIIIHKYGPHAFHTDNKKVWDYLSHFTEWQIYFHKVLAVVDGIKIPLPFNLNSIYKVFPANQASKLEKKLIETFGYNVKIPILKLKKIKDKDLQFLANYIYEKVFLGYTIKQWNLKPEELDESVTSRVPVYISRDDRYFQDKYQGIPADGYDKMVENILNNKLIKIELGMDFNKVKNEIKYDYLIYTGSIDEFFDYKFGKLPYRSLEFKIETFKKEYFQEVAQVNYPENYDFTRITEFKHFLSTNLDKTTIAYEFPQDYKDGKNEPYYPIPNRANETLFQKYRIESKKLQNVIFLGRLAEYKYYNMDKIVERALKVFEEDISKWKK